MSDLKNLTISIVAAIIILVGWQYFYEKPKLKEYEKRAQQQTQNQNQGTSLTPKLEQSSTFISREESLRLSEPRIKIEGSKLKGSIALKGLRIDDIILPKYHEEIDPNSAPVTLLSPSKTANAYFVEFGWFSEDTTIDWPNAATLWSANKSTLRPNDNVVLSWQNKQKITFIAEIALDDNYMFTVKQTVKNAAGKTIFFQDYGLINRLYEQKNKLAISHEGSVGVFNKILKEVKYDDLKSEGSVAFNNNAAGSWFGISDKYWLTAIIPDQRANFDTKFHYSDHLNKSRYQADYTRTKQILAPGDTSTNTTHLFVGAKTVSMLDFYGKSLKLDLFDRAIDFGWFYFITKPMFHALKYFYELVGNFGISILIVTIIVKLILFPLANRSYKSMNKMKKLQPEMAKIKELHADDKMKQNQAVMDFYRKEKVSPLSGCLPLLIQIPIFFSLYKVLFITIEMRHTPFYGWIKDLSAPDPTTVFNLFGLIPWAPPSFLMIGVWPLIMALTMFLQQKMSPEPTDPVQAKVMKLLPLFFVFMFASFPAGLVIYWAWSNILSIIQQYYIKSKAPA
jgi:YidC/Oxa1 family membrane protein insertase